MWFKQSKDDLSLAIVSCFNIKRHQFYLDVFDRVFSLFCRSSKLIYNLHKAWEDDLIKKTTGTGEELRHWLDGSANWEDLKEAKVGDG